MKDFLQAAHQRDIETNDSVPYFEPYRNAVNSALNYLCTKKPCILLYADQMDSREMFLHDLRKTIDNGSNKARYFGIPRGLPFIVFNCADFNENIPLDMLKDYILESIGKDEKVVLIGDEADSLFDVLQRPNDFLKSSIFTTYPTLFFVEDKYKRFTQDELAIMGSKFNSAEQRYNEYPDLEYEKAEAFRLTSKKALLSKNIVELPIIKFDEAVEFLFNPVVQKHILAQNNDIKYNPKAILYALTLANADLLSTENIYGSGYPSYLLDSKGMALDSAISLLQMATVDAMNLSQRAVQVENIKNVYPYNHDLVMSNFAKLIKQREAQIEAAAKKEESKEKPEESQEVSEKAVDEVDSSASSNYSVIRNPQIKFSDIGGMFNVKKQIKEEFLDIMKNKNIKNSQKPNGILLYGPPGCGKTLLAKAIAGEAGVPFVSTAGSSFVEIYVGTGAKRVRELYNTARREAKSHPSKTAIVFIDEVDSAASQRKNSDGGSSEDMKTVDALLHEMDGTKNKGESDVKIITIVATNNKDMLDGAFTRSGRIDIKCFIDDPRYSEKARLEILKIHAKSLPFRNDEEKEALIAALAKSSAGMSGADMAEVIKKAYRLSLREGRENIITQEDINEAKMRVQAGIKTDVESSEYEKRQTIAREAGHAVNSMILEKIFEGEEYKHKMPSKVLDFISNSARGGNLGSTYFKPSSDNKTVSKESCFADIIMLYGSYAVETQLFDTHTSNVEKDMEKAAEIIEKAVMDYDFGSSKHFVSLKSPNFKYLYSEEIKNDIAQFSERGMKISQQMIKFAKPFIADYVNKLMSENSDVEVSAEDFKSQFNQWLEQSGKKEEFEALCKDVKSQISDFCRESQSERAKLGF